MSLEDLQAFKLDDDHDLEMVEDEFGNKDLVLVSGVDYVGQSIEFRLLTPQTDYPLDRDFGFPYNQAVGIFNRTFIAGAIRRALADDPDISEILAIEINLDQGRKRTIDVTIQVRVEDGTVFGVEAEI